MQLCVGEYDVDGIIYRKENIEALTEMLCWKIMVSAGLRSHPEDNYEITIEDSIKLYKKAIEIFKIVYDKDLIVKGLAALYRDNKRD